MKNSKSPFRLITSWLTFAGLVCGVFSPAASAISFSRNETARNNANIRTASETVNADVQEKIKNSATVHKGFEENRGQFDNEVRFHTSRQNQSIFLTSNEAVFTLPAESSKKKPLAVRMEYNGANKNPSIAGVAAAQGKNNYFRGNDPGKWQTEVSTFEKVKYQELYEGVDLMWYSNHSGELEYDFIVAPNADYQQIELKFKGAKKLEVAQNGDLLVHTRAGTLRQRKPFTYQAVDGEKIEVASRYKISGKDKVNFVVSEYDREKELVIDPTIVKYGTFLGGSSWDYPKDMAIDNNGNIYIVGMTRSSDFPKTNGVLDASFSGDYEVFVSKFDPTGKNLLYSTYVGGSSNNNYEEVGNAIKVDAAGNVYVVGTTPSSDFPTTVGSYDRSKSGEQDAFVFKLNPTGSGLVFSTFLGAAAGSLGYDLVLDSAENINVTGYTLGNLPITVGAFDTTRSSQSAFYTKLNSNGSSILYCTYLSGTSASRGYKITADSSNNIYVTGYVISGGFPVTTGAYRTSPNGGTSDAFVTKFSPTGNVVYSTYLGGSDSEGLSGNFAIVADADGNCYVAGSTKSTNFPTTEGAMVSSLMSSEDGFVTKLNSSGNAVMFSTLVAKDIFTGYKIYSLALDSNSNMYISSESGFVGKINPSGSRFMGVYQMNNVGTVRTVKMNSQNELWVVSEADTVSLPVTPDAFDATLNGATDVGLVKVKFVNTALNSDFDGDGKSDVAVYRNGMWHIQQSTEGNISVQFGASTDVPTPADFDGDGKSDIAVWRDQYTDSGYYILQSSDNTYRFEKFGISNDDPTMVGDYDGDGKADPAVYRNAAEGLRSYFYYRGSLNNPERNITYIAWGANGDKPVNGDYNGDGKTDFAVFRPSDGTWYILNNDFSSYTWRAEKFGLATDKLVPADYDGDAKTDVAVFRPSNGTWYIRQSSFSANNGNAVRYEKWGLDTDTLIPADYDGDGKVDVGVWRNGSWYFKQTSNNAANLSTVYGSGSDKPIQSVFVH